MKEAFIGRYDGRLTADGAIVVPDEWATILRKSSCVGIGVHPTDKYLIIGVDEDAKSLSRVTLDAAGRISVPPELRRTVQLADQVVLVGGIRCICVWDKDILDSEGDQDDPLNALIDEVMED